MWMGAKERCWSENRPVCFSFVLLIKWFGGIERLKWILSNWGYVKYTLAIPDIDSYKDVSNRGKWADGADWQVLSCQHYKEDIYIVKQFESVSIARRTTYDIIKAIYNSRGMAQRRKTFLKWLVRPREIHKWGWYNSSFGILAFLFQLKPLHPDCRAPQIFVSNY